MLCDCDKGDGGEKLSSTFSNMSVLQGKLYVRGDSKVFRFQNGKSESLFLQRKNPRRIAWTVLYRRQHKKGISEVCKIVSGVLNRPLTAIPSYRRSPRSAPAAPSSTSAPSSVLRSM